MAEHYEKEFKEMIVELYNQKKDMAFICNEYKLKRSLVYSWVNSSKKKDEPDLIKSKVDLVEENKRLKRELESVLLDIEILKKAASILGKK